MSSINGKRVNISDDNPSIVFDPKNCDECGICKNICKINLGVYGYSDDNYSCINCGSCTIFCPKKCLLEKDEAEKLDKLLHSDKIIVFQIAPAVRVALGEEFGYKVGSNVEGKIITALRMIGGNYVFDTTFGADLTVMEEANELVDRIKNNNRLPMFTSCCPAWVKFIEMFYPEIIPNLSTCKSPIAMQSSIIKSYFAKINNIDKRDIISISITPCTAKKMERIKYTDTDLSITTRELARYLKSKKIDLKKLKNGTFNSLMGRGSGGGIIFGTSGGVMEATIREVYHILYKRKPTGRLLNFREVRGLDNVKEAEISINNVKIKVAVINGTGDARKVLDKLKAKEVYYDFVEVMACEGGCISGGGQPNIYPVNKSLKIKRMKGLYKSDKMRKIRNASSNPDIIDIYDNFLGEANSEVCYKYLHNCHIRGENKNEDDETWN